MTSDLGTTWCQTLKASGVANVLIDGCTSSTAITFAATSTAIATLSYYASAYEESTTQTGPLYWSITAFGLELIWQSSDEALRSSFLASMSGDISSSATIQSASPTPAAGGGTRTSGLSTGAKAGIGCGVGIGASVALLGALFVFCRHRKRRQQAQQQAQQQVAQPAPEPGLPGESNDKDAAASPRASELHGGAPKISQAQDPESWRDSQGTAMTWGSPSAQGQWTWVPAGSWVPPGGVGVSELGEAPPQVPGQGGPPSELVGEQGQGRGHGRNLSELSGDSNNGGLPGRPT